MIQVVENIIVNIAQELCKKVTLYVAESKGIKTIFNWQLTSK